MPLRLLPFRRLDKGVVDGGRLEKGRDRKEFRGLELRGRGVCSPRGWKPTQNRRLCKLTVEKGVGGGGRQKKFAFCIASAIGKWFSRGRDSHAFNACKRRGISNGLPGAPHRFESAGGERKRDSGPVRTIFGKRHQDPGPDRARRLAGVSWRERERVVGSGSEFNSQ